MLAGMVPAALQNPAVTLVLRLSLPPICENHLTEIVTVPAAVLVVTCNLTLTSYDVINIVPSSSFLHSCKLLAAAIDCTQVFG